MVLRRTGSRSDIRDELVRLRSRRGIERPDLGAHLGPSLRALCGVGPADREARIRQAVIATLERLTVGLAPDLRQAARLAFALDKDHRYPTLEERLAELARLQNRSLRTGRRLMDHALAAIVAAAEAAREDEPVADPRPGPGWRVDSLRVLFRLDTVTPELYEMRTIVATEDIDEVTVRLGLPPAPAGVGPPTVDAMFGARVRAIEYQPGRSHYRVVLRLPETVPAGRPHEFWLRIVLPPDQPIWSHYAIVPLNPCEAGTVRVRFPVDGVPGDVWLLDAVPYLDLNVRTPGAAPLRPGPGGEVVHDFTGLREGYGYGVAWASPA